MRIVVTIISSLIITTILGVIYFNQSFKGSVNTTKMQGDINNSIATIGDNLFITNQAYALELRRASAEIRKKSIEMNSQISSKIQLSALNQAIKSALLLEAANEQNLKVSRKELNNSMLPVFDQFNVSSKSELKKEVVAWFNADN